MSRIEKLLKRFLSAPKDFTWEELVKILASFGYEEIIAGKTGDREGNSKTLKIILSHFTNLIRPTH